MRILLQMKGCMCPHSVAYKTEATEMPKVMVGKEVRGETIPF